MAGVEGLYSTIPENQLNGKWVILNQSVYYLFNIQESFKLD